MTGMIGEILAALRKEHGLTQGELARILNVTPGAISNYEHNRRQPKLAHLITLSRLYHVSVDFLTKRTKCTFPVSRFDEEISDGCTYSQCFNRMLPYMSVDERREECFSGIEFQLSIMKTASLTASLSDRSAKKHYAGLKPKNHYGQD